MSTSVDHPQASTGGQDVPVFAARTSDADVPGMMADRIGNLWATEERLRRNRRTERMILRAQSAK